MEWIQDWSDLLPVFRLVLASLEGVGAVKAVDYLKDLYRRATGRKLVGELALVLTFIVCAIFAALGLIVEGALNPEALESGDLVPVFIAVFTAAKVRYDQVRRKRRRQENAQSGAESV